MQAQSTLGVSSAELNPGTSTSLGVALTVSGTAPAGLEWTIAFSSTQLSAVSISPGPSATAAEKTVSCSSGASAATCILTGLNTNVIGSGVVAYLNATVAPGTTTASIQISNLVGVDPNGNDLSITSAGGGLIVVPSLSPLTCSPTTLSGGAASTCTVTLTQAAPAGGSSVNLVSNNSALTVPASVSVAAGATTATFSATAAASIGSNLTATVTATFGGSSQSANVSLLAPGGLISSLSCSPTSLVQNAVSTCTVALTQAAPAGGSNVTLASNNASLTVPASVTVAAGATTATFSATAAASIGSNQSATITATLGSSSQTTNVSLLAPGAVLISSLSCSPAGLVQNAVSTCTVALTRAAPAGGSNLTLASNNAAVSVPASVKVPWGATTSSFKATASVVKTRGTAIITASLNGSTATALLTLTGTVRTPGGNVVSSLVCSPGTLTAGGTVNCELLVPSRAHPVAVRLNSSSDQVMIPAVVTTRMNQSSLTFQGHTGAVAKQENVTITATLGDSEVEDTIQLMGASGPVLRVPQRRAARAEAPLSFSVSAIDPTDLPVQVKAVGMPAGASFDPETGVFEWSPKTSQTGKYRVAFSATNTARQSSTAQVELEVDAGLPVLNPPASCSAGAIGTLTGKWLAAPDSQLSDSSGESFDLGGTSVAVNGKAAPVLYASANRVDFVCPAQAAGAGSQVSVEVASRFGSSQPVTMGMMAASPAILSLDGSPQGQGLIRFSGTNDLVMDRNYRVPSHPAQPGDQISILATGLGSGTDLSSGTMLVQIGDVPVVVESVGAVPGRAGVLAVKDSGPGGNTFRRGACAVAGDRRRWSSVHQQ